MEDGFSRGGRLARRPARELAQRLKADYEMIGKLFRQYNVKLD